MHKEVSKNILREIAFHVDKYIYMADTVLQKVFNDGYSCHCKSCHYYAASLVQLSTQIIRD